MTTHADRIEAALAAVVAYLTEQATRCFDEHGPLDARGAALWDAARAIDPADGNALATVLATLTPEPVAGGLSEAVEELTEAIRFTVEYVGTETLPPIAGWSWFDALTKYAPEKASALAARAVPVPAETDGECVKCGHETHYALRCGAVEDDAGCECIAFASRRPAEMDGLAESAAIAEALDVAATLLRRVAEYWAGRPLTHYGAHIYEDFMDVTRAIEGDRDHHRALPDVAAPKGHTTTNKENAMTENQHTHDCALKDDHTGTCDSLRGDEKGVCQSAEYCLDAPCPAPSTCFPGQTEAESDPCADDLYGEETLEITEADVDALARVLYLASSEFADEGIPWEDNYARKEWANLAWAALNDGYVR